jgi:ribosomal protein L29
MAKEKFIEKKDADLAKLLKEKREALRSFRFGITGSKTRNVKEGRDVKKTIARILTEVRQREIQGRV